MSGTTYPPPPPRDPRATYIRPIAMPPLAPQISARESVWFEKPERSHTVTFTIHWGRIVSAIVVGIAAGLIMTWALDVASDKLPPCATEDSVHCYWDADTMGNGVGHDVVTR